MITQGLIKLLLLVITPILNLFPNITLPPIPVEAVGQYVGGICYFLPVDTINSMLTLFMSFLIIRVIVSFLKTLWAIIPIA